MTSSCCHQDHNHEGHDHANAKRDWVLWGSMPFVVIPYLLMFLDVPFIHSFEWLHTYCHAIYEFVNMVWWGVALGVFFLALMSKIPREFVMSVLGNNKGMNGIARAMGAGVLLDLCNHGILMIATKIYQRGASIGQVMAFLIASPWNSISLTFILISMIGLKLTIVFLVLSCVIAFISGVIFDALVKKGVLPSNPNAFDMPEDFKFFPEAKRQLKSVHWSGTMFKEMLVSGIKDSQMVVRWLVFGIMIAALLRVFLDPAAFATYFGPTVLGMVATVAFATILEVCSEGSSPIAADLVTRAGAPGNAFTFLMAGVSTDYTEIMILRDMTKSWKVALFLPLVTLPQIVVLGYLLNL